MATQEEKLKLVEELKAQIDAVRTEIAEVKQEQKRRFRSGTLFRTGVLLLLIAIGFGLASFFLN